MNEEFKGCKWPQDLKTQVYEVDAKEICTRRSPGEELQKENSEHLLTGLVSAYDSASHSAGRGFLLTWAWG